MLKKLSLFIAALTLSVGVWAEAPATVEYVDLGLPSGLKWATMNVGATKPEEYGDYFAWGETSPKTNYDWSTYKWCNGSYNTQTKYCTSSFYGTVDNKTVLDPEDDAAHVNWGGNWRMPTKAEQDELRNTANCVWTWTSNYNSTGVAGYIVTSTRNSNTIFLPASGNRINSSLSNVGSHGDYWSSSLDEGDSYYAYYLNFRSDDVLWSGSDRYAGRSVRPVYDPAPAAPAVTNIDITGDLLVGSELTFTATVASFSAEPTVIYEIKADGGEYKQAQGGKFTPTAAGNYTVKATAFYQPDEGDAEEASKEVEFTVTGTATGIKPIDDAQCTMHNAKFLHNGQLIIRKGEKHFNVLGAELR